MPERQDRYLSQQPGIAESIHNISVSWRTVNSPTGTRSRCGRRQRPVGATERNNAFTSSWSKRPHERCDRYDIPSLPAGRAPSVNHTPTRRGGDRRDRRSSAPAGWAARCRAPRPSGGAPASACATESTVERQEKIDPASQSRPSPQMFMNSRRAAITIVAKRAIGRICPIRVGAASSNGTAHTEMATVRMVVPEPPARRRARADANRR